MKYLTLLIVPLVLYMVGYMSGPMIGAAVVKERKEDTSLKRIVKGPNGLSFDIDLAEIRSDDLPKVVSTVGQLKLPTLSGGGFKSLPDSREVKLLNRKQKWLIIETMDGLAKGEVRIDQTDIFERIGKMKMEKALAASGEAQPANPEPVPAVVENNDQLTSEPQEPAPSALMANNPAPAPEPDPKPVAEAPSQLTEEQIVEVMQESIRSGLVKVIKFDQVEAWKAGENEEVDGSEYQTGLAAYSAETIFGKKTVQAKALIKDGKVARWVYAKTGMEIQ